MPRYIDATKAISLLSFFYNYTDAEKYDLALAISAVPTADVQEVKHGKWVWLSSTYDRSPCEMRFWCSECHHETIVHTNGTSDPWEHYCPNCGARMC